MVSLHKRIGTRGGGLRFMSGPLRASWVVGSVAGTPFVHLEGDVKGSMGRCQGRLPGRLPGLVIASPSFGIWTVRATALVLANHGQGVDPHTHGTSSCPWFCMSGVAAISEVDVTGTITHLDQERAHPIPANPEKAAPVDASASATMA